MSKICRKTYFFNRKTGAIAQIGLIRLIGLNRLTRIKIKLRPRDRAALLSHAWSHLMEALLLFSHPPPAWSAPGLGRPSGPPCARGYATTSSLRDFDIATITPAKPQRGAIVVNHMRESIGDATKHGERQQTSSTQLRRSDVVVNQRLADALRLLSPNRAGRRSRASAYAAISKIIILPDVMD